MFLSLKTGYYLLVNNLKKNKRLRMSNEMIFFFKERNIRLIFIFIAYVTGQTKD